MSAFIPTIAVDAMGGDQAPRSEVEGAVMAAAEGSVRVILVGPQEILRKELARQDTAGLAVEIVHASQAIAMQESAARAARQKRDSSIRAAARLVKEGTAQGIVSAGNTGAVMATVKMVLGALPSVDRPALAAVFPALQDGGKPGTVLIDVGANVDCKPEQLGQFAVMGAAYCRLLLQVPEPRVGLLSIGTEQGKGNELTRETYRLLERLPLRFVGNVEGRDLFNGSVDVVVCDGFTGNVALKISEGLAEAVQRVLRHSMLRARTGGRGRSSAEESLAQAIESLSRHMDYSETGGASLLGVKGVCTIGHGSSSPRAIKNAIRLTREVIAARLNETMEAELGKRYSASDWKRPTAGGSRA
ncbi:MAG TPA: phosphate acyltransferase PlsX [Terriglobia bacterium]|nr:phosphate acyltransferase PlsX [Terriglobia bacterium]